MASQWRLTNTGAELNFLWTSSQYGLVQLGTYLDHVFHLKCVFNIWKNILTFSWLFQDFCISTNIHENINSMSKPKKIMRFEEGSLTSWKHSFLVVLNSNSFFFPYFLYTSENWQRFKYLWEPSGILNKLDVLSSQVLQNEAIVNVVNFIIRNLRG